MKNQEGLLMTHSAFTSGSVAVVTGGAAGIGLAAAKRFAQLGLRVCIADVDEVRLNRAAQEIARLSPRGANGVMAIETDVSRVEDLRAFRTASAARTSS
jgi:NAD(P)-dependent dehydrogenase (short-subunit alcohol dehydrogenase family)